MDGVARGDEQAVRELHRRFAGPIRTVARSLCGDPSLVDEVVQETFLKAWRAAAGFETGRDPAPWLYAIARRTAIDTLRRERRAAHYQPEADQVVEDVGMERTWEAFEIRRALDALPPDEREVVRLSHLVGMTHSEIAERMGVPVGTVKSRSSRAHRRLAAALEHLRVANHSDDRPVEGGEKQP